MDFTSLNLHEKILEMLVKLDFSSPTPIQMEAIPQIIAGKDVLASADTGTGKTAAFLLPAIHMLADKAEFKGGPRVLILSPTRELASQIEKEAVRFGAAFSHVKSVCVFGGAPYSEQMRKVQKPHQILVATPGRLIDLMEKNKVDLSHVDLFIIDEADRMLDMGFVEPVNLIASKMSPDRQTLLFSATLKGSVLKLCQNLMIEPVRVEIEKAVLEVPNIAEHFYFTNDISHKHRLLNEILEKDGVQQAIIFTSTKRAADELTDRLNEQGHETAALHGDMKQRQRDRTIRYLRKGEIRILVATDVAARGIDVQSITHVVNFDLPMQAEDYVHRIGRTGRAGATGEAHSFASKRDRGIVKDLERITGKKYDLFGDSNSSEGGRSDRGPRAPRGDRPSFNRERRDFSDRGDRPSFNRERKPFGERSADAGDRPFRERKPFGERSADAGDRPFRERKPFGERSADAGDRPFRERKPFGDRPAFGDRPSFGDRKPFGERKSFGDRPAGERSFGPKKEFFGEKRSFDSRVPRFSSDRRGSDRPAGDGAPKRGKKVFTSRKKSY